MTGVQTCALPIFPQKRLRIFGDIKNNDWDCVILTHDQFKMIPQSPEVQQSILQEELQDVEESLWQLEKQGNEVSRAMINSLMYLASAAAHSPKYKRCVRSVAASMKASRPSMSEIGPQILGLHNRSIISPT